MALFLKKLVLFFLILSGTICLLELGVPYTFNTFRNWEHLRVYETKLFHGPFYPNFYGTRDEYGDLAHHSPYQIKKENILWITDSLGFRNERFIPNPDILFIGRSNITGSSLDQQDIISSKIQTNLGLATYNLSPTEFQDFIRFLENGVIDNPKILIYGCVEKQIPNLKAPQKIIPLNPLKSHIKKLIFSIPSNLRITLDKLLRRNTKKFIQARIHKKTGVGIPSPIDTKLFFYEGNKSAITYDNNSLINDVSTISAYKTYCEERGIRFIFFPIPNKETIYYEWVPFDKQPSYLKELIPRLKAAKIEVINTVELFNTNKKETQLYQFDDSHWNQNGIEIVSREIVNLIKP